MSVLMEPIRTTPALAASLNCSAVGGTKPHIVRYTRESMQIELWTDGASSGTSAAPGGWAFILRALDGTKLLRELERSGGETETTNNRMELMAVLEGLRALTGERVTLTVFSDSEYVVKAFMENWIGRWESHGWRKTKNAKRLVVNADIWRELVPLVRAHDVTFQHVRGHAGTALNERVDRLAVAAKQDVKRVLAAA